LCTRRELAANAHTLGVAAVSPEAVDYFKGAAREFTTPVKASLTAGVLETVELLIEIDMVVSFTAQSVGLTRSLM
jgi:hypothetical protein